MKKRVVAVTLVIAGVVSLLPLGAYAVQNIFTDLHQITDIQFVGQNIDQVVYQGTTIWERQQAPTGANIQQVGAGRLYLCPTTRTRVRDARDGATYWIQKLPDGKCWMLTNLAYAGGGNNTYGDTRVISQNSSVTGETYTSPQYFVPPGSNRTTGITNPSTSTSGIGQYGYLYNWCAAMGSQTATAACLNATAPPPTTSRSICPSGWRLPTGNSSGEFQALNTAINGGSTTSDSGLLSVWLGMYGGDWYPSSGFIGQNIRGYYWSSSMYSAPDAYNIYFNPDLSQPYRNLNKPIGLAVRCIAA